MKGILIDENVPFHFRLETSLKILGSRVLGDSPTDTQLWNYAKEHELIILSKDADFFNRMIISEPPPKIVQLKIGNMRKNDFHNFLSSIWPEVESALQKHKLVRVYRNHLECI